MEPSAQYSAGVVLGKRYEVIAPVASGAMATVYLACDARARDTLVALKVLNPALLQSAQALARFRGEIIASYRVEHSNVVRAFEYFDEANFQAYAMEYVDGGSLRRLLRSGPLDIQVCLDILKQVAVGLNAIHAVGIVHRDLKPENILISKRGEVKISDFGVARVHELQNVTHIGKVVGTAQYVAPEYVETGECDHRSDLYALGVIAYEMIAGSPPYPVQTSVLSIAERFVNPPAALLTRAPHCPQQLADVVERAMKIKLNERYQSVDDMLRDLESVSTRGRHKVQLQEFEWNDSGQERSDPLVETVRIAPIDPRQYAPRRSLEMWILAGMAALLALVVVLAAQKFRARESVEEQGERIRQELLAP